MIEVYTEEINGVWFGVASDQKGVYATTFARNEEKALYKLLKAIPYNAIFKSSVKPSDIAKQTISTLKDIYSGFDASPNIHLHMDHLSNYTKKVLHMVLRIPAGYVSSYGLIATAVGGGARAVGRVVASNPFILLVPCHRVVTSNLSIGGYSEGAKTKLEILTREKRGYSEEREILTDFGKMKVFPVEFVLSKCDKGKVKDKR
ncbi:MAG: methylated-DNA--[protein]-cysteine S-methyltransferase [Candidatus Bathyarchaeia archaeon]